MNDKDAKFRIIDSPPKITMLPLDPDVVTLLHRVLDQNERILNVILAPPIVRATHEDQEKDQTQTQVHPDVNQGDRAES